MQSRLTKILVGWLIISSVVLVCSDATLLAQNKYWREIRGKPLVQFDWNCSSSSAYPEAKLHRQVATALKREEYTEGVPDRAFAFDLNRDGKLEYFVPLVCGAVGNCTWGVFALAPARFLGAVNGQYIFVHQQRDRWPAIVTYGHLSAMEGVVDTHLFTKGRYRMSGKGYPTGEVGRTLEIQNVPARKLPGFLKSARGACKDLGS